MAALPEITLRKHEASYRGSGIIPATHVPSGDVLVEFSREQQAVFTSTWVQIACRAHSHVNLIGVPLLPRSQIHRRRQVLTYSSHAFVNRRTCSCLAKHVPTEMICSSWLDPKRLNDGQRTITAARSSVMWKSTTKQSSGYGLHARLILDGAACRLCELGDVRDVLSVLVVWLDR